MTVTYCEARGPAGPVFVAATRRGVCAVAPVSVTEDEFVARLRLALRVARRVELADMPSAVREELREHGVRARPSSGLPLDLTSLTEFQRSVLTDVATIPAGETRSYREVAEAVGRPGAARAVGGVMACNPVPFLVPCHRVVRSGGSMGGYGYGVGLKRSLLAAEGWPGIAA
jgi:O-6-methylguanine DNA methyltransferase